MLRSTLGLSLCAMALLACVGSTQQLPLAPRAERAFAHGVLQVERVEGGEHLVVIELESLIPPEKLALSGADYVVWLEPEQGDRVRAGTLRYDRRQRSGMLVATTAWPRFTVRVTAEPHRTSAQPSVVVAERKYVSN